MDEEQIKRSPEKQKIFKESLAAVLNNTMFLQQIVNVYRSFSFIKRPRFEYVDVNRLLSEIVDLFRLSTSANIDIRTSYAAEIPPCRLEERLVKLAVFNILTNALDAIRRKPGPEGVSGFINVKTLFDEKQDQVVISIRDSGDGIRNEKGELATPIEIERVFNLGFTTKKEEEGEGLGLNWVYTIITEFHKGRIQPRNHPEGGAEFLIYLHREIPEEEPVHLE
jgi:signal transduction histidine kinase